MPKLMLVRGIREGESFAFTPPGIFLGRETDNDLQLPAEGVSRYHAKMTEENGVWQVTDLDSSNGVKVNGAKISGHTLADGDLLYLGKVVLRFIADPPAAPPPPPTPSGPGVSPAPPSPPAPPTASPAEASSRARFREREKGIQLLVQEAVAVKHRRLRRLAIIAAVALNLLLLAGFIAWQMMRHGG